MVVAGSVYFLMKKGKEEVAIEALGFVLHLMPSFSLDHVQELQISERTSSTTTNGDDRGPVTFFA
jgi:hypothetical protein